MTTATAMTECLLFAILLFGILPWRQNYWCGQELEMAATREDESPSKTNRQ